MERMDTGADADVVVLALAAGRLTVPVELRSRDESRQAWRLLAHVQVGYRGALPRLTADESSAFFAEMAALLERADDALARTPGVPLAQALGLPLPATPPEPARHQPPTTLCALPFRALDIDTQGHARPCCLFAEPLRDETGRPFSVREHGLTEIWQSAALAKLRQDMLDGKQVPACARCWQAEAVGAQSRREYYFLRRPELATADLSKTVRLEDLSLCPGNLCNLKCRTCGPASSSSVALEWRNLPETAAQLPIIQRARQEVPPIENWLLDNDVMRLSLQALSRQLQRVEFVGGEPSVIDAHFDLLRDWVAMGRAKEIELDYTLNGTRIPEAARELWPAFRRVNVRVSLDAVGARFEYLRYPAKWSTVSQNTLWFREIGANVHVVVNATLSAYNVLYLHELIAWAHAQELILGLSPVFDPPYFDPAILPDAAKRAVAATLMPLPLTGELRQNVEGLLLALDRRPASAADQALFFAQTHLIDAVRGQSFAQTFPELAAFLDWDDRLTRIPRPV